MLEGMIDRTVAYRPSRSLLLPEFIEPLDQNLDQNAYRDPDPSSDPSGGHC